MKKWEVSAQTSRWLDETDHRGSIEFIKKCGFEGLDFNINSLFNRTYNPETLTSFFDKSLDELYEYYRDFKDAAKEQKIAFSQMHGVMPVYYPGEPAKTDYFFEVTKKMIAIAAYLDCPSIVVHPWGSLDCSKEEEIEVNMGIYRRLMPAAKEYGVKICLENLYEVRDGMIIEGTCVDPLEVCRYVDTLNEEGGEELFGFCLDVGHLNLCGKNIYHYIKTIGKRLTVVHIHDNNGTADSHMIPYTQMNKAGDKPALDWEGFIRGLRDTGYEGAIAFEIMSAVSAHPVELRQAALTYIAEIGKYFRGCLEKETLS